MLDSEILAEVYLELIGGRQPDFVLASNKSETAALVDDWRPKPRSAKLTPKLTEEEIAAHTAFIEALGDDALWKKLV